MASTRKRMGNKDKESDVIIKVKDVSYRYEDRQILKNVNWIIRRGEFWALIGENGTGKTTLSKIIAGLIKDYGGEVEKYGKVVYLPQHLRKEMMPFKAKEIVNIFSIKKRFIEYFNLKEHLNKSLDELSGGLYQALFTSLALSIDADVYILDEPTTNLDRERERKLYGILKEYVDKGKAVVLITHDIGFVKENVKHIACIHKGIEGLNFHCALDEESIIRHGGVVYV